MCSWEPSVNQQKGHSPSRWNKLQKDTSLSLYFSKLSEYRQRMTVVRRRHKVDISRSPFTHGRVKQGSICISHSSCQVFYVFVHAGIIMLCYMSILIGCQVPSVLQGPPLVTGIPPGDHQQNGVSGTAQCARDILIIWLRSKEISRVLCTVNCVDCGC